MSPNGSPFGIGSPGGMGRKGAAPALRLLALPIPARTFHIRSVTQLHEIKITEVRVLTVSGARSSSLVCSTHTDCSLFSLSRIYMITCCHVFWEKAGHSKITSLECPNWQRPTSFGKRGTAEIDKAISAVELVYQRVGDIEQMAEFTSTRPLHECAWKFWP